jgi:hypothetical protein
MINPSNFPDWVFTFKERSLTGHSVCFDFKSPRMLRVTHYNPIIQEDSEKALVEYEKECYLNQVMFGVAAQIQVLQSDIRRQLKIHVERNLPLPSELKACIDLKIVY